MKLPAAPAVLLESMATRMTCCPADRLKAGAKIVCQLCQPPVFGTAMEPVLLTPSNST